MHCLEYHYTKDKLLINYNPDLIRLEFSCVHHDESLSGYRSRLRTSSDPGDIYAEKVYKYTQETSNQETRDEPLLLSRLHSLSWGVNPLEKVNVGVYTEASGLATVEEDKCFAPQVKPSDNPMIRENNSGETSKIWLIHKSLFSFHPFLLLL